MGIDYTFQMVVPCEEAVGTMRDLAALLQESLAGQPVGLWSNGITIPIDELLVLCASEPYQRGMWIVLPTDEALGKDGRPGDDTLPIPDGHSAFFAELTVESTTASDEASFTLAAVTSRDSRILAQSTSFRAAMRKIAGMRRAYYCVVDREDDPLLVTWFHGEAVEEELPSRFWLPSRPKVEKMMRAVRIERDIRSRNETGNALEGSYRDPDHEIRTVAAKLLSEIPDSHAWLLDMLHDPSEDVRAEAARSLGNLKYGSAVSALMEAVGDGGLSVRVQAIEALGKIGSPVAIDAILSAVDDADTRSSAFDALCNI